MQKVLILGGGIGGIVASTVLKKASGINVDVTLVEKDVHHHFAGSYPMMLVGKRKPEDITRDYSNLGKKGINVFHREIRKINLIEQQVTTNQGVLDYDILVIALGAEYHPETIPGFSQYAYHVYDFEGVMRAQQSLALLREGHIVLFISGLPIKCPPAPYEMMFLIEEFLRKKGKRSKVNLTLVTPEPSPEPLAGPLVGQSVRKMLEERGIDLITGAKVLALEPGVLILDQGQRIFGDLFFGIPSHWSPQVLRDTDLVDDAGWVQVDSHTLQTRYPGVYAIGDAAAIKLPVMGVQAPKAGIFAHYQAEVAARNIALIAQGKNPTFRYTGKGACIMNTGFGRARYSMVRYYHKPGPFITLFRPSRAAYWSKLAFEKYWLTRWL